MVQLRPMTPAEYESWLQNDIKVYAGEKVRAGSWDAADALERSAEDHREQLPDGLGTKDNYFYMIMAEAAPGDTPTAVGILRFAAPLWKPPLAFVYDSSFSSPIGGAATPARRCERLKTKCAPSGSIPSARTSSATIMGRAPCMKKRGMK